MRTYNHHSKTTAEDNFVDAKISVLKIKNEIEAIAGSGQFDEAQLDLLWSKLENIKQDIFINIRVMDAQERGISVENSQ